MQHGRKPIHSSRKGFVPSCHRQRYEPSTRSPDSRREEGNGGAAIVRADKESRYDDERRRAQAGKPYARGD